MTSRFDRGVFTLSFDFELVWGSRDLYPDVAPLAAMARITRERVFPALLQQLTALGMVATWATVGSLFLGEARREGGLLHPTLVPPRHAWRPEWLKGVPEGLECDHPEFYARSLVIALRDAGQEVGSHSFTHPVFGDVGCSRETADSELRRCVQEASKLGIPLRSFVFPRNVAGHVDLLAKHGFTCWRGLEPVWYRRTSVPGPVGRIAHLAEVIAAKTPPTVMPVRDRFGLWNIPASSSLLPVDGVRRRIPIQRRVDRAVRGLDAAASDGRISHLYTHPINLASDPAGMLAAFQTILTHAARLRDAGRLDVLPMAEVAQRAAASGPGPKQHRLEGLEDDQAVEDGAHLLDGEELVAELLR